MNKLPNPPPDRRKDNKNNRIFTTEGNPTDTGENVFKQNQPNLLKQKAIDMRKNLFSFKVK